MSPMSQTHATPGYVKLTKREIGKAAAALMQGEQSGMKGLEAAYGLPEGEDLPAVWHRFFEDMQSLLLNKAPPEAPTSSPFKTLPELLCKALKEELTSFKNCLRTFSKVAKGLCELRQQFRQGEVTHALRISTPKLQLTDPILQDKLNQDLDKELKTFKTKAQLTLMAYKEKEKAVCETAAEVWSARTFSGFKSFLEKDLHLFETHAAPNTPAPDAYLKELAADFMARGMARELMYHAVWIKRSRNSKARVTAKREKVRDEQARGVEIQANPSTDLIALVKTLPAQTGQLPDTGPALDRTALQAQEAADRTQTALAQNAQQPNTPAQPALQAPMQPATSAYPFMAAPSFPSMYQQYPFAPMQPTIATGSHFLPHTHPFLFSQQAIPLQHTSAPAQPALSNMSVMPAAPAPPAYTYASTTPPPQQVAQGPQAQMAFGPPEGTGAPLNINYAPAAFGMPMRFLC
ncbi:unnamed protein product [Closterium sp. Naga37s-1]|nr:unnamed protein product [Closterium sp. Naga37s-1]